MTSEVKYDVSKLNRFVKAMSEKYVVKVGIMGTKNARNDGNNMSNARLGAIHELGFPPSNIPPRSFLKMPLARQSSQILKQASAGMLQLLADGKTMQVLARLGIACENAIQEAFASGGFGVWKKLKPQTIQHKGSDAILIDTGQLRRAISSKVEKV